MLKIDKIFFGGIISLIIIGSVLIGIPAITQEKHIIVKQISNIYDEPIFMKFYWKVNDEIQVGDLMNLKVDIIGLPYNQTMNLQKISLSFDEKDMNYWEDTGDKRNLEILPVQSLNFVNWNDEILSSNHIQFRFIVPIDVSVNYCDYNLESACHEIENIVHPAAYDLKNKIAANRIILTLSFVTIGLSATIVWSRIKDKNKS